MAKDNVAEADTRALADHLLRAGAVKFGDFRLKMHATNPAAPLSPIYVDLRLLRSFPDAMETALQVFARLTRDVRHDLVADVPTAGTPFATLLAARTRTPMVTPRTDRKSHGSGAAIDGVFSAGQRVLLVDDLITRADSKLEAIEILQAHGLIVEEVVVLVDRGQGGPRELERRGIRCRAATTLMDLIEYYRASGRIDQGRYERTRSYLQEWA